jgi:arylsulfatase A-like enzyme
VYVLSHTPHLHTHTSQDDVGFADVSFTAPLLRPPPPRAILTPQLDALARRGVVLAQYYTHSTCTPSRASLMTGRYAQNTGLSFAMLPGSVAGLPEGMETLPKLLREGAGYAAHMIGKWHVGHAQWKQTPVGSNIGFETHVGSYLWSMEYWRKGMWELPWQHFALDWVRASENRTYAHYAEPRHTTVAITKEAVARIETHAREASAANAASSGAAASAGGGGKPLFLYVAYTAAHAPLEPEVRDLAHCTCEYARLVCDQTKSR